MLPEGPWLPEGLCPPEGPWPPVDPSHCLWGRQPGAPAPSKERGGVPRAGARHGPPAEVGSIKGRDAFGAALHLARARRPVGGLGRTARLPVGAREAEDGAAKVEAKGEAQEVPKGRACRLGGALRLGLVQGAVPSAAAAPGDLATYGACGACRAIPLT